MCNAKEYSKADEYGTQKMPRFDIGEVGGDWETAHNNASAMYYQTIADIGLMALVESSAAYSSPLLTTGATILGFVGANLIAIPEYEKTRRESQENMMENLGYTGAGFFDTFYNIDDSDYSIEELIQMDRDLIATAKDADQISIMDHGIQTGIPNEVELEDYLKRLPIGTAPYITYGEFNPLMRFLNKRINAFEGFINFTDKKSNMLNIQDQVAISEVFYGNTSSYFDALINAEDNKEASEKLAQIVSSSADSRKLLTDYLFYSTNNDNIFQGDNRRRIEEIKSALNLTDDEIDLLKAIKNIRFPDTEIISLPDEFSAYFDYLIEAAETMMLAKRYASDDEKIILEEALGEYFDSYFDVEPLAPGAGGVAVSTSNGDSIVVGPYGSVSTKSEAKMPTWFAGVYNEIAEAEAANKIQQARDAKWAETERRYKRQMAAQAEQENLASRGVSTMRSIDQMDRRQTVKVVVKTSKQRKVDAMEARIARDIAGM